MLKITELKYDFVGSRIEATIRSAGAAAVVSLTLSFATLPVEGESNGQRMARMKLEAKMHLETAIASLGV